MATQQRNSEEEESGEITKDEQTNEEFKAGRQGTDEIKEE
jgi:hypothetical protein